MNLKVLPLFLLLISISKISFALEFGCQFMPTQAIKLLDKSVRNYFHKQQINADGTIILPNIIPLQNQVQQEISPNDGKTIEQTQYEAILRPKHSDYFQLLHLIMFKLERTRHLMYVCFNENTSKPNENHVTIYFLSAYGLEPISMNRDNLSTVLGDWLMGPNGLFNSNTGSVAEITRIPIELLPLHYATNGMSDFTEDLPYIGKVLKTPGTAIQFSGNLLNQINQVLRAGVERIVITSKKIEFASSVDLSHPENAKILYEFSLTQ